MNRNNVSGVMPEQIDEYRKVSDTLEKARTPGRRISGEIDGLYDEILIDADDRPQKRQGRRSREEAV